MHKYLATVFLCCMCQTASAANKPINTPATLQPASQPASTSTLASPPPSSSPPPNFSDKRRVLNFAEMGQPGGAQLSGIQRSVSLNAGVRLDELISSATLKLQVVYPTGMRHDQSFIRVYLNNQLAGLSPLIASHAGGKTTLSVPLDPTLFSDYTNIRLDFEGTYDGQCVDPQNPTLHVDILPESTLEMVSKPLSLVNDLALLPAPFFDARDSTRLRLSMILPPQLNAATLKAAGIVSSWFGSLAFYRQASFTLANQASDTQHSVILSTGQLLPPDMKSSDIQGPMVKVASLPNKPWIKQLYILGRNEDELMQAVLGLIQETNTLSGAQAQIKRVEPLPLRAAYDNPRHVPTKRPVRFGELQNYDGQLEATNQRPEITLNLRLPADLFSWTGKNIPMTLKYRYTAPSRWNDSLLNLEINRNLIQSFRLPPRENQTQNLLNVNVLGQSDSAREEALQIPAFRAGSANELKFNFSFMPEGERNCTGTQFPVRGAIDPESTLDFSDLPHYIRMPNLAAFANDGYPFSVYADLSQTAVILPDSPNANEVQAWLNLMGLFGQWTGVAGSQVSLLFASETDKIRNKDWITLGTIERLGWLQQFQPDLPMTFTRKERSLGGALIQSTGPLGALMGFESPFSSRRAGIVITGSDTNSFDQVLQGLSNFEDIARIRGSVTLFRDKNVESHTIGSTYISGQLSWWLKVRIAFSEHPALIAFGGIAGGVILAILLFGWLSGQVNKRLKRK